MHSIASPAPAVFDESLAAVVDRYVERGMDTPGLTAAEREALVEYLGGL